MNEIVNKCINAEMNLRQPGVFGPFTKNKEKKKNLKKHAIRDVFIKTK